VWPGHGAVYVPLVEAEGDGVLYDAAGAPIHNFRLDRNKLSRQNLVDANFIGNIRRL
jgi:hypothetical protein